MFQRFKQFDLEIHHLIFKFLIELRAVTLSCIFSEFVGTFFHNLVPLTEILYLDIFNPNGGILLKVDMKKFVGYL